jgi:hypothetical protein
MSLDGRGIDQDLLGWTTGRGQGMEDVLPDAFGRPADETIVERLAWAVGRRGIDPAATALQHMNDPADDTAIINPWFACLVQGFDGSDLR